MKARIWGATIFVDHFSNHVHVHLMRSSSQDKTLAAKRAYGSLAATHEVTIQRYHTDNGRFAKKYFRAAVDDANQSISYCGVGTHHQNVLAENHIKQLTLTSHTLLLHAKRFCPEDIITTLWPFALKTAAEVHNRLKTNINGGAESLFGETSIVSVVSPNGDFVRHGQTFICSLGCERLVL